MFCAAPRIYCSPAPRSTATLVQSHLRSDGIAGREHFPCPDAYYDYFYDYEGEEDQYGYYGDDWGAPACAPGTDCSDCGGPLNEDGQVKSWGDDANGDFDDDEWFDDKDGADSASVFVDGVGATSRHRDSRDRFAQATGPTTTTTTSARTGTATTTMERRTCSVLSSR